MSIDFIRYFGAFVKYMGEPHFHKKRTKIVQSTKEVRIDSEQ